jgi:type IV secretory pathway VirJ component
VTLATLALTLGLAVGAPSPAVPDSLIPVGDLPLTLMQTPRGSLLAVVITGDGGWASGDKSLAAAFVRRNVAVVGLSSPKYLIHGITPDEAGQDLARILGHFLDAWHRDRAVVVGYSRGADIGPFMVSRLPRTLRDRVALTALLGPGQKASFRFALLDLFREHGGSRSLPVGAEVAKLRGTPVLCIYGAKDQGAICPALQAGGLARAVVRSGGHAVHGSDGPALVDVILGGLPSSGSESSNATAAATNVITAKAQMKQPSAARSSRRLRAGSGERRLE